MERVDFYKQGSSTSGQAHMPELDTIFETGFGRKGKRDGQLDNAVSVIGLPDDNSIAVADMNNRRIQVFDRYGTCMLVTGMKHLKCPWNLCSANDGQFYLADGVRKEIVIYDGTGEFVDKYKLRCSYEPNCLAVDESGAIFVSDYNSSTVHVYNSKGNKNGSFVLEPDPEVVALNPFEENPTAPNPEHMVLDKKGQLLVSFGSAASRVHIYTTDGRLLSAFGDFANATCLHVTKQGRIVVVDRDRQTVSFHQEDGSFVQNLLSPTTGLRDFPHAATMISGNLLVVSVAEDTYGFPYKILVFSVVRKY